MHLINRRRFTALGAFALGAPWSGPAMAAPGYPVPAAQLQRALAERFPLRYAVTGLFELTLAEPRLRLLPDENRLGTQMVVQAAGAALRRPHSGQFDLDFALRYERADHSVRAHRLRVQSLRMEGLRPEAAAVLERSATSLAEQQMLEIVLHRLRPGDLALAQTMGLEPGAISVTAEGLLISFANKPVS